MSNRGVYYPTQGNKDFLLTPRGNLYSSPILNTGPRVNTKPIQEYVAPTGRSISDLTNRGVVSYTPVKNGQFPNGTSITRDRNVSAPAIAQPAEVLGATAGIFGAASIAAPALAPVAAVAGVGYGVYKLGETFHWW